MSCPFSLENVKFRETAYTSLANSPYRTAKKAYAALIDKISGKGTWDSNPYVFVYEFELVK